MPPKAEGTAIFAENDPEALVCTEPRACVKVVLLMPVVCGGFPPIIQAALDPAQSRVRFVLGVKPAPVTVILEPTMSALGETVSVDDAVAAVAEPTNRRRHSRAAVAATMIFAAFSFGEGNVQDCIADCHEKCTIKE